MASIRKQVMLPRLTIPAILFLIAGAICSNASGQQSAQPSIDSLTPAAPVSYKTQDEKTTENATAMLQEQIKRMEIRLRELENDVGKKLDSQPSTEVI